MMKAREKLRWFPSVSRDFVFLLFILGSFWTGKLIMLVEHI